MPAVRAKRRQPRQYAQLDHRPAAAGTEIARIPCHWKRAFTTLRIRSRRLGWRWNRQQLPAEREFLGAMAVGEQAVMPDAMGAVRQGMEQKAPDELVSVEGHDLRLAVMPVVLPAEANPAIHQADQAGIRYCDTVRVAAEIGQHLLGAAEGRLGVDHPLDPPQFTDTPGEGGRRGEFGEIAEEAQLTGLEGGVQTLQEQAAE